MILDQYLARARGVGVTVELLIVSDLELRLAALIDELQATSIALPLNGWPEPLLCTVQAAVEKCGSAAVSPRRRTDGGYEWNRPALASANLGITFCGAFIAATGSLAFPSGPGFGTLASLLPETQLALSYAKDCRPDLASYLAEFGAALPSRLTFVTGPSRTGDIEASMTTCVHGPGRVLHWIIGEGSATNNK
ncbi:MAG: LUD domain-containing protein [Deltaproteobacteria bacterium]|nr:LUD domain-containing protein [Deltaproteobacteria bacterium]